MECISMPVQVQQPEVLIMWLIAIYLLIKRIMLPIFTIRISPVFLIISVLIAQ